MPVMLQFVYVYCVSKKSIELVGHTTAFFIRDLPVEEVASR